MNHAPVILVPGAWLGAWAWDEVATILRAVGCQVTALTLPGLESRDTDRSTIRLIDHVDAICEAIQAAATPVVLCVHSYAGCPGYAATDRVPDRVSCVFYVDTAPATGALDPERAGVEWPLPPSWEELDENLDGISEAQLETFRARAVPHPALTLRDAPVLTNPARLDIPSTVVCTSFPSAQYKAAISEGYAWLGGLAELRNVTYVDMPTSHWPMWSLPDDLAALIGDAAEQAGR